MDQKTIIKALKNKKASYLDIKASYAVFVPIVHINGELHVLFEVRAEQLSQPGEICFPGGRIENNESPLDSAIRETIEELNISNNQIDVIGPLDILITPFNLIIYPYCGFINDFDLGSLAFNSQEVSSVFTVPLQDLLQQQPINHPVKVTFAPDKSFPYHLIQEREGYQWKSGSYPVYFYKYGERIIWGITAKILKNLLDCLTS